MDTDPLVRVVRGAPAPEELAALVGVLAGVLAKRSTATHPTSTSPWVRSARPVTKPTSWRQSGLPS